VLTFVRELAFDASEAAFRRRFSTTGRERVSQPPLAKADATSVPLDRATIRRWT
jgi:hypothetical protein